MINREMRTYNYFTFGDKNDYGQPQLSQEPQGTIKMAINLTSHSIQNNINYKDCTYIGLTTTKLIDDNFIIEYGNDLLKVVFVNPVGRFTQVFMNNYDRV